MGEMADDIADLSGLAEEYAEKLHNSREHYIHSIMKTDDTGTAKVLAIQPNGTFKELYKQEVSIEIEGTAVTVQAFSKGETPPYKIGDEVEYIIGKEYKGMYNAKLKKPSDYQPNTNKTAGKEWVTEEEKYPSIVLSYANQFAYSAGVDGAETSDPNAVADYVTALADRYLTWLNENS